MSKITRTQNLGVSQWRATSCATIGPESCLGERARGKGYQESCLGRVMWRFFECTTKPLGGKFWIAQPGHLRIFGVRNVWCRCTGISGVSNHVSASFGQYPVFCLKSRKMLQKLQMMEKPQMLQMMEFLKIFMGRKSRKCRKSHKILRLLQHLRHFFRLFRQNTGYWSCIVSAVDQNKSKSRLSIVQI